MKYEDFWSIYFTIWRIFLIFYLTHSCICLLNYHHLYYLSETASFLPMFLLLILNYCCSDGYYCWGIWWVWLSSLVSGLSSLVFPSIQLNWQSTSTTSILPSGILPVSASCQIVLSSASWFLPCWLLFILWFTPGIGLLSCYTVGIISRRPKPVARRSLWSRQLSRQCVADPWWCFLADNIRVAEDMKFDDGWCRFTRDMSVWILLVDTILIFHDSKSVRSVNLLVSKCQLVGESVFTYIWNQMKFKYNDKKK